MKDVYRMNSKHSNIKNSMQRRHLAQQRGGTGGGDIYKVFLNLTITIELQ